MKGKPRLSVGLSVRTGRAVVVALRGPVDAPEVVAKSRIDVAHAFEEGAVFHVAQDLPIDEARNFIESSEQRFIALASEGLSALLAPLGAKVIAACLVAGPVTRLPPLEKILKAHPLLHASEGELYRRVFSEACAALHVQPARVALDTLHARATAAFGISEAQVSECLSAMGKAAGRPWAADQKHAALAAWVGLARG